jgi:hypothetical protein
MTKIFAVNLEVEESHDRMDFYKGICDYLEIV